MYVSNMLYLFKLFIIATSLYLNYFTLFLIIMLLNDWVNNLRYVYISKIISFKL